MHADPSLPQNLQLRPLRSPTLPLLIPQQPPQNLPTGTLRNNVNKFHTTLQPLMSRLMLFDMFLNLSRYNSVIVFQAHGGRFHYKGFGDFPRRVIRDGNYGAVGHGRVGEEVSF